MKTLLIAAALIALAAPAAARDLPGASPPENVKVVFTDLNLSTPHDADAMITRLTLAARKVCGDAGGTPELGFAPRYRACVADITRRSVARLNAPLVTARFDSKKAGPVLAAR